METVFTAELEPFLNAVAGRMSLYVPKKVGEHYVYSRYDAEAACPVEFSNIRTCTPVKEYLFPLQELAAVFPDPVEPPEIKPFAVFGLKDCDLRSIEVLDKVFLEDEFKDPFYVARRDNMFIISTDCFDPAESCFCNIMGGGPFPQKGFDLNLSQVEGGFLVEVGSKKGQEFVANNAQLFTAPPEDAVEQRNKIRAEAKSTLEKQNARLEWEKPIGRMMHETWDSQVYDEEAKSCVECQACTRVCPTCHCFFLYDTKQADYFGKMKMWDGCMRMSYAAVAGGENPRKLLGGRLRHRLMHKFAYFFDRYGIDMCVGCGRCIDAESGAVDIRRILDKLSEELRDKKKKAKVAR
jgi:sulfhydrogenase subunit beta (sulfur reductase)